MYNAATIKTELIGLVGWRQNADPSGWQLIAPLTTAPTSGLYFNDVHPLLSFDNLISIAPDFPRITFPAWSALTSYAIGDKVLVSSVYYIAIAPSLNQTPPNATYWAVYDPFTAWLKEKTEAGIIAAVDDWLASKSEMLTASALLSNDDLFKATGNISNLQAKAGNIVGLEIIPARSKNVILKIDRIGIQFDTNQTVRVYLFKSGRVTEVAHLDIVYAGAGAVQWADAGWELSGEGSYFIAYNEDAITGQAVNGVNDHTYLGSGVRNFPSSRYFQATAFTVDHDDAAALWDLTQNQYSLDTNFGLNLTTSARCSYTDFIVRQKNLFKTVIAHRVGMDLLREMAFNPQSRINRNAENITKGQVLYEIEGDTRGNREFSLSGQYKKALAAIQFDTNAIDPICLSCRRRGIRIGAIGPA